MTETPGSCQTGEDGRDWACGRKHGVVNLKRASCLCMCVRACGDGGSEGCRCRCAFCGLGRKGSEMMVVEVRCDALGCVGFVCLFGCLGE